MPGETATLEIAEEAIAARAPARRANSAMRRFCRHRLALLGAVTIAVLLIACAIGPLLLPWTDTRIDILHRFQPPGAWPHVAGTDQLGRDMLARLLMAGRISLAVGFAAMAISTVIGTTIGLVAGFYGGAIGAVLMRLVDAVLCFPNVFLLLTLAAFVSTDVFSIILLIAFTTWMEVARIVQAQIRALREREFAVAAEALGAGDARIMLRELLPNAVGPITVAATLIVAHAILSESYISYLGYGIQPPTASWGNMLDGAQSYLTSAPWLALLPGALIAIAVLSFNFLGDGLRDAFDPRMDGR
jgi:peptide/nickel transport system permease protein